MKKFTTVLICAIFSFIGLNAQTLTLPYFEEFSTLTSGNMESATGSNTSVASPQTDIIGIESFVEAHAAGGAIRFGTSSTIGGFTTKEIVASTSTKIKLSFKAVTWTGSTPKPSKVAITYGSQTKTVEIIAATHNFPLTADDMNYYSVMFNAETNATAISLTTVSETGYEKRIFMDDLKISELAVSKLIEGFENTLFPPKDWKAINVRGTNVWERTEDFTPIETACAAVRFQSGGHENWLITPQFTVEQNDEFSFQIKTPTLYGSSTTLKVLISTTGNAISDFQTDPLLTLQGGSSITTNWEKHTVSLSNYIGQNIYIAFQVVDSYGIVVAIDDITGGTLITPSCSKPEGVTTSNIMGNSATISWNQGNGSQWLVEYSQDPTFATGVESISTTGTPSVNIDNLTPSTSYYVRVKTDCYGGEMSQPSEVVEFRSACGSINIGYTNDFTEFDANSNLPFCWTKVAGPSDYPKVTQYQGHNANGLLEFYSATWNPETVQLITLPQISTPINNIEVGFWVKRSLGEIDAITFEVGVMDDPTNPLSFNSIQTITTSTQEWTQYFVSLANAPATHNYIAFRMTDNRLANSPYLDFYLDEVEVTAIPTCVEPSALALTDDSATSFGVSWTNGGNETEWAVEYKKTAEDTWQTLSPNPTTNSATLSNLERMTSYDVRVKSICSDTDQSRYTPVITRKTRCSEFETIYEDFESYPTYPYTMPYCWTKVSNEQSHPAVKSAEWALGTNSQSIIFKLDKPMYAIMPRSLDDLEQKLLTFNLYRENENSGIFQVGVMASPTDTASFEMIAEFDDNEYRKSLTKEVYFNNTGTKKYIAFRYGDVGNTEANINAGYAIDSISVTAAPNCRKPININVSEVTDASLKLNFKKGTADQTAWQYVIATSDVASPDQTTAVAISDTTYTITGLTANTNYKLWVRTDCAGEYSAWTTPILVGTACNTTIAIGYTQDFENLSNNEMLPDCWRRISSNDEYPKVAQNYAGDNNLLKFIQSKPQYVVMPKMAEALSGVTIKFDLTREGNGSGIFQVGYMSDATDASTFVVVKSINESVYTPLPVEADFINVPDDNGKNRYIAFRYGDVDSTSTEIYFPYYIDNIEINAVPSCMKPTEIAITETTSNSITLTFNAGANETDWEYAITNDMSLTTPDGLSAVAFNTNPYTIDNLQPNTEYKIWVRAVCSSSDSSAWSLRSAMGKTLCGQVSVTWEEHFDSGNSTQEDIPMCWTKLAGSSTQWYGNSPSVNTYFGHDANGALVFKNIEPTASNGVTRSLIATPQFTESLAGKEVRLWLKHSNLNHSSDFEVGLMADLTDTTNFIVLQNLNSCRDQWTEYVINIPQQITNADSYKYLAFRMTNEQTGEPQYIMDDLSVVEGPSCIRPKELNVPTATITGTSAQVNWIAGGSETQWTLEYKEQSATDWTSVNLTDMNYIISGLQPIKQYDVRVKSLCVVGSDESEWATVSFQTPCGILSLPFAEDFSGASISIFPPNECWRAGNGLASEIFAGTATINESYGSNWKYSNNSYGINSDKARINIYGSYLKSWLITPTIRLESDANAVLNFKMSMTTYNSNEAASGDKTDDKFIVAISTDEGATWSEANATIWSNDGNGTYVFDNISATASEYTIDLAQYSGNNIQIGFYAESTAAGGDNDLYIDDISVDAFVVAPPTVTTNAADGIGDNTATLHKTVVEGNQAIDSEGFRYRTTNTSQWRTSMDGVLTTLLPGTTYEFYAYAVAGGVQYNGDTLQFNTTGTASVPPTVTTMEATDIAQTTAKLHAIFAEDQSEVITEKGWKYKASTESVWTATQDSTLNNLQQNTQYEFYAYAKTAINTSGYEGAHKTFTTLSHTVPTVTTEEATAITYNSATLNKTVVAGTEVILEEGWFYKPKSAQQWTKVTEATIVDLIPNTAYEFYAYAQTASFAETKGSILEFTTKEQSTGIDLADYGVVLYPNPAKDIVNIVVDGLLSDADITIVNMQGKVVGRQTMTAGQKQLSVDVSDYATGNYFVKINSNGNTKVARLIVK
ncbi:MAG: hypothetical protein CSA89_01525 [Bacteroidales bacterium]|nr:MAG: hypothetical protein CSA89_01525 [Bacteroidales bacterium]